MVDLFILPLEVLVSGNDPLLSKEGGREIDIDGQVDNLSQENKIATYQRYLIT